MGASTARCEYTCDWQVRRDAVVLAVRVRVTGASTARCGYYVWLTGTAWCCRAGSTARRCVRRSAISSSPCRSSSTPCSDRSSSLPGAAADNTTSTLPSTTTPQSSSLTQQQRDLDLPQRWRPLEVPPSSAAALFQPASLESSSDICSRHSAPSSLTVTTAPDDQH